VALLSLVGAAIFGPLACGDVAVSAPDAREVVRDAPADTGEPDRLPPRPRSPDGPPAARLMLSATDLDFGTVNIGNQATSVVVVTNTGDLPGGPLSAALAATSDFAATHNCGGRRLGIGETCVVTVRFAPTSTGVKTTTGQVNHPGGDPERLGFTVRGTGRLAPDAGPQDAARETAPDAPPGTGVSDGGADRGAEGGPG
jgi:hypothetical protein